MVQVSCTSPVSKAATWMIWNPPVSPAENQPAWPSLGPLPQLRALLNKAGECQALALFLRRILEN